MAARSSRFRRVRLPIIPAALRDGRPLPGSNGGDPVWHSDERDPFILSSPLHPTVPTKPRRQLAISLDRSVLDGMTPSDPSGVGRGAAVPSTLDGPVRKPQTEFDKSLPVMSGNYLDTHLPRATSGLNSSQEGCVASTKSV
jgi:hypothetical protein